MINPQLDREADMIEAVLEAQGITVRVEGGRVLPTMVEYDLLLDLRTRLARVMQMRDQLALALGVSWVRIERRGGQVVIVRPREDARVPRLSRVIERAKGAVRRARKAQRAKYGPGHRGAFVLLGTDRSGKPYLLDFASPATPHVLVAGTTGSGKTTLLKVMLLSAVAFNQMRDINLVIISPKPRRIHDMAALPYVLGNNIVHESNDVHSVLDWALAMMKHRDREGVDTPRIVIFIDELADIIMAGGDDVRHLITRLAQRGREAGIHLVAATQRPSARELGGLLKANFPARLVGALPSPTDAKVAAGIGGTGAENLSTGEFLFVLGAKSEPVRVPVATSDEIGRVMQAMSLVAPADLKAPVAPRLPEVPGWSGIPRQMAVVPETPAATTTVEVPPHLQRKSRRARREDLVAEMRQRIAAYLAQFEDEADFPSRTRVAAELGYPAGGHRFYLFKEAWEQAVAEWREKHGQAEPVLM